MDTIATNPPSATTATGCNCAACKQSALERVRYFPRQLLTVDDMLAEQNYFREKLRRHNRYLHGTGVVCGLTVTAAPTDQAPWTVAISEGYALGPYGDDIFVAETVYLDLARCAAGDATDPCDPSSYNRLTSGATRDAFIAIKYSECFARPVRSMGTGCGCDNTGCEYSRIRDSFELGCIPRPAISTPPTLCSVVNGNAALTCPPAPSTPWVLLAGALLPASTKTAISDKEIVNSVRQYVFSTTMIQRQVIQCCCGSQAAPVPVQVTTVTPANGAVLTAPAASVAIVFNQTLTAGSVNAQSVLVTGANQKAVNAKSIAYNQASNTATFTPGEPLELGVYTVTVKGAGSTPVTGANNLALDGQGTGQPGSDHVTTFTVRQNLT